MPKKILIVDDDARNMKLCRDLLTIKAYEIVEANDGVQGVEMSRAERPDLILMDIMMPKMDGFEATRIIRKEESTRDIPIIALTSFAMKGDKERTIDAGCSSYMAKPIDITELLQRVTTLLTNLPT